MKDAHQFNAVDVAFGEAQDLFGSVISALPGEPLAEDDKYSGGVVAICAGSAQYPGAGVLCSTAAVRTTSSMVRYIGESAAIVAANPEVVAHEVLDSAGRAQAFVVGPGRGTDTSASAELKALLSREEALVIDADALTVLSQDRELRGLLRKRESATVLTPHAGECARLLLAVADDEGWDLEINQTSDKQQAAEGTIAADRLGVGKKIATSLKATVLLKGRKTVVTDGEMIFVVDAGSSWGATAGSGDVLAGIIGALIARPDEEPVKAATTGVFIHSVAAYLSAQTEHGPAPTSASRIAEKIPSAIAILARHTASIEVERKV